MKIDKVNCVQDNKVMEQDELSNFIDGVINNNLEPKVNEVVVGFLSNTIIDYLNSISVGVMVQNGSRNESEDVNGISHFIEHMFFKGTAKRNAKEISCIK